MVAVVVVSFCDCRREIAFPGESLDWLHCLVVACVSCDSISLTRKSMSQISESFIVSGSSGADAY